MNEDERDTLVDDATHAALDLITARTGPVSFEEMVEFNDYLMALVRRLEPKPEPDSRRLVTYTFYDGYGAEAEPATVPADEASTRAAAFVLAQASEGLSGRVEFLNPEEV
jgi:hypothetical protein